MSHPIFSKSSDFWNSNVFSENFRTFFVGDDKGFEFCRKIFDLGPLLYRECGGIALFFYNRDFLNLYFLATSGISLKSNIVCV